MVAALTVKESLMLTPLRRLLPAAAAVLLGTVLASCGGGGTAVGTGSLRLALTDAPACGYDHVFVTVDRVRVHRSADAAEADGGWVDLVLPTPRRIDLLTLTNGVLEELGQTPLPAGRYTQMRLVLAANGGSGPAANAVHPSGADEVALDTPSATASGLKMQVDIEVADGQLADFVIDFDACKSVVPRGASGRYNLKPVLRVLPRLSVAGARVVGYADQTLAGASVSLQLDGQPVAATVPDPTSGRFELYPVPVGTYRLVIAGGGFATGVIEGVPVSADAHTVVNASASPITLPAGAARRLPVAVSTAPAQAVDAAFVRVTQTLAGGKLIEIAERPVEVNSPVPLELALAAAVPQVATYSAGAGAVVFSPDAGPATAGVYAVTARVLPPAPAPALAKTVGVDLAATPGDPMPLLTIAVP